MKNVTYLLGAGASAEALPIHLERDVNGVIYPSLSDSYLELAKELRSYTGASINQIYNHLQSISKDLIWLHEGSKKFDTTDTYAKFLYANEDYSNLQKLKKILSFFFVYRQFISKKTDNRALVFLTTLMKKGPVFPDNVKIISWNYDMQIQLAMRQFMEEKVGTDHRHSSLIRYYPALAQGYVNSSYSMLHLNGIAGYKYSDQVGVVNPLVYNKISNINEIIEWYNKANSSLFDTLKFAWENDKQDANLVLSNQISDDVNKIIQPIINLTEILVIVGYSFPFFNRDVDTMIFQLLKSANKLQTINKLEKIYMQNPTLTGEFLYGQFRIHQNIPIIHIRDCDNYFIPPEL